MTSYSKLISKLKNISCLSLLSYLLIWGISGNAVGLYLTDDGSEKIELAADSEGENQTSEQEILDNLEIDEFYQQYGKRNCDAAYQVTSVSLKANGAVLEHHLDVNTPPPE
jgi:hypothetical protein